MPGWIGLRVCLPMRGMCVGWAIAGRSCLLWTDKGPNPWHLSWIPTVSPVLKLINVLRIHLMDHPRLNLFICSTWQSALIRQDPSVLAHPKHILLPQCSDPTQIRANSLHMPCEHFAPLPTPLHKEPALHHITTNAPASVLHPHA